MTAAGDAQPAIADDDTPDDAELERLIERQEDLARQLGEASRQVLDAMVRRAERRKFGRGGAERGGAGRWNRSGAP